MLIEVKVRVSKVVNDKTRWVTQTYVVDRELFAQAEYTVTSTLEEEMASHLIEDYTIQSLRTSSIREIAEQFEGEHSFIATLTDIFITDSGVEKKLRYKVLLWANSLTEANTNTQQLARQGYDMHIEGIKEVDYIYLNVNEDEEEGNQDNQN
jgi:hypothetical protein